MESQRTWRTRAGVRPHFSEAGRPDSGSPAGIWQPAANRQSQPSNALPRPHLSGYAALVAAREVIVPCQPSHFSVRSLATLSDEVRRVQQTLNPKLRVRGYFLSLVSPHSTTQATCRRLLNDALGADRVFKTAIPLMPVFDMAVNLRKPITEHARSSPAAAVFRRFALELLGVPLTHAHPRTTA